MTQQCKELMGLNYIADGCTLDGYIAAVEGLHDDLSFSYRPTCSPERAAIFDKVNTAKTPQDGERYAAAGTVSRIVEWDFVDNKGGALAVSTANALRMQPQLLKKLFNVVMGISPTDIKPEGSDGGEQTLDQLDASVAAAVAGVGETEEDRLGN